MESYIKKILNELEESQEELDEMSVTGNLDGGEGPPKTPFAFGKGRRKDKKKTKDVATNSTGMTLVKKVSILLMTSNGFKNHKPKLS